MIYGNPDGSYFLEKSHEHDIFYNWGFAWKEKQETKVQFIANDEGVELCLYTFDLRLV